MSTQEAPDLHHEAYIAGVKYRPNGMAMLAKIADETELELKPQPENPYDPHAVMVLHDGFHLGFVPRELSKEVAGMIAGGRLTRCVKRRGNRIDIYFTEKASDEARA